MVNLWRLIRVLSLVGAVVLGGLYLIHHLQTPDFTAVFTNPDGSPCQRPCLLGVQPGQTPYHRAIQILQAHPFSRDFAFDTQRGMFSGPGLSIILFEDEESDLSRIDLVRTSDASLNGWASLGQVIAVLGVPDAVGVETTSIWSYYRAAAATFGHSGGTQGYVTPDEQFDCLFVFAQPKVMFQSSHPSAWHGFSSVERYHLNPNIY